MVFLPTAVDASGPGSSLEGVGPSYTLTGAGNGYHAYTLVYNPVTQLADLSVDGITRIQGYSGDTTFKATRGLYFGAAEGREIPWNQVSRINQEEMKTLMTGVVNRIHTFLARTLFSPTEDKAFQQALDRAAAPWTKPWDEPEYLADFLMPDSEKQLRMRRARYPKNQFTPVRTDGGNPSLRYVL